MNRNDDRRDDQSTHHGWSAIFLIGFGIALLGFLVAIDRQNWFHLRPASGTATAMAYAAEGGLKAD